MMLRKKQTKEDRGREEEEEEEEEEASSTSSSEVGRQESDDDNDDNDELDSGSEESSDAQLDVDATSSGEEEEEEEEDDDDEDDDDSDDGLEEEGRDNEEFESGDDADAVDGKNANVDDGNVRDSCGGEQCTFDLTNLLAFNTHQINIADLYRVGGAGSNHTKLKRADWYGSSPTIESSTTAGVGVVNESLLLAKAVEGTTQLLRELWRLPTERTDVGMLARLPTASAVTKLPRSLPPPPPKQPSKWEQFALKRGIVPQSKRSRKVYDESTGEWKHLTGSAANRANAGPESWPIIEVKKNDDPNQDPWEKLREEKRARVGKNTVGRMRNAERAGVLEKGSANRLVKDSARLEKQRAIMREKDRKRGLVAPAGVPTDMPGRGGGGGYGDGVGGTAIIRRGKPSTTLALKATQVSTASLGRFDRLREGEPERKGQLLKSINGKKRKQFDADIGGGGTNKNFLQSEARQSSEILNRVINGPSSKERERDVRKGKFAKGETAYDYDFDDGLGGGSFRKKKGRAGAGKMKKVTKKRIK